MDEKSLKTLKAPKKPHPFDRMSEWSVVSRYNVPIIINFNRTEFPDGWALDVEDDEEGNFVGLGIGFEGGCFYFSDFEKAKQVTIPKFVAHNSISDLRKLQKWGFKVDESWILWDTMLMEHILDSSQRTYGLKDVCKRRGIGEWPEYSEICGKKGSKNHKTLKDFDDVLVAEYNAADCWHTYRLYLKQCEATEKHGTGYDPDIHYFEKLEQPVSLVFEEMSSKGIRLDVPYLTKLRDELNTQKAPIEARIKAVIGDINLNSPKQLLEVLHAKQIQPELKGKPSTDKRALARLSSNDTVSLLLQFSELETLLSSFVIPYLERGTEVVHPNYHQTGTRTGRPSCSNPNLLQIPRKTENGKLVRRMFVAREGHLYGELDYGQIEPRVMAHLSKDEALCGLFNHDIDFHTYTSERLNITRERAKVLNLSVGYRATYKSVSQQLKCSEEEAQKQIDAWWSAFPQLYAWQTKLIWQAKRDGYFTTLMGRRIKVEGLNEYNKWRREAAERQLINNIAQASATEVMKMAMIEARKQGVTMLVQVYDSLLIEEPEEDIVHQLEKTADVMRNAAKLNVPLTVDYGIGSNWADIKKAN